MVKDKPVFRFIKKPSQINEEYRKINKKDFDNTFLKSVKEEEREEELSFDNSYTRENDEMDLGTINFTITFD